MRENVSNNPSRENPPVQQRLFGAIDAVLEDAARVELWASALNGFARPVPDYRNPFEEAAGQPN